MQTWSETQERTRLAQGIYDGYLNHAAKKIREKLPLPLLPWEDVFQEMMGFALEAVFLYDPNNEAQFSTFLYSHLQLRSLQWFNVAWMNRNQPEGKWILTFSLFKNNNEDEDSNYDPTLVRDFQRVSLATEEFLNSLSPRARQLFEYFCTLFEWDETEGHIDLMSYFTDKNSIWHLSKLTKLKEAELVAFFTEVKIKAISYMEGEWESPPSEPQNVTVSS